MEGFLISRAVRRLPSCNFAFSAVPGSFDNTLSYESQAPEVLVTEDGSSLDAACVRPYMDIASHKTSSMMKEIDNELLRSGCSASVSSTNHAHSMGIFENQVLSSH